MYLQILIIDPDLESAKRLKYFLQNDAVRVYYTVDVLDGIRHLAHYHHQLVIMDVPGDGMDGFQSLRLIQELALAPILVISADHEPEHIVRILSIADNFTVKPLDLKICEVKIQALIRRSQNRETAWDAPPVLSADNKLLIDPLRRKVQLMNVEIHLSKIPFDLLYFLASNPGRVFTREQLCERFWDGDCDINHNTLCCQINHVRRALRAVQGAPDIYTSCGV